MSKYGEEIDSILRKSPKEWTSSEGKTIYALIKGGQRAALKELRAQMLSDNPTDQDS